MLLNSHISKTIQLILFKPEKKICEVITIYLLISNLYK